MPTYDYRCRNCGHTFEKFQSITDRPVRKCPICGKLGVKRLIGTGAAVIFKGSGFYQTDYRSADYQKRVESESSPTTDKKPSKSDDSKNGKPKSSGDSSDV